MAKHKQQEQLVEELDRQAENHDDQEETPRMSRQEAAIKVVAGVRSETTLQELAEEADRIFVEGRGGDDRYSDVEKQTWITLEVLNTAEGLGVLTTEEEWIVRVMPKAK
jgi:hypothetical protein